MSLDPIVQRSILLKEVYYMHITNYNAVLSRSLQLTSLRNRNTCNSIRGALLHFSQTKISNCVPRKYNTVANAGTNGSH